MILTRVHAPQEGVHTGAELSKANTVPPLRFAPHLAHVKQASWNFWL